MDFVDSFKCLRPLKVGSKTYAYFSLPAAEKNGLKGISRLPFSLKVLLENLLRNEDGRTVTKEDIQAVAQWLKNRTSEREIAFRPARVLMQDFTGVPAVVDLAAMRDAMEHLGGDPTKINPLVPVDLVIDHSVAVNFFAQRDAFKRNVEEEYKQNLERYRFLKWAQLSFKNFRVVPPGTGICHQVNLEYLAQTVCSNRAAVKFSDKSTASELAFPDTVVGTDSHTTMVNGLSVLGWGVGGIEAEAAMLGQPYSMLLPEVIGVRLNGKLKEGVTATDLVLTVTQMLRRRGVVGKFVEYFGPGLANLTIADRATLGNMSPEYGATCGFFPIDDDTLRYLRDTGRPAERIALVTAYAKAQGMYRTKNTADPVFTDVLKLELSSVEPSLAGPKRPQDRIALSPDVRQPPCLRRLRRSTESAVGRSPGQNRGRSTERGSASVDFVLVGGVLTLIFVSIMQLTLVLHVRNTLIDAAGSGARYGTLADRGAADARERTVALISAALTGDYAQDVHVEEVVRSGVRTLRVTVRAPLPALGLVGPRGALEVHGHAALPR